ncbi:TOBE domain-containing protein [Mesorhizobium onobrychidis]|uniref:TOBE domain-containing protein n=1 Tax=Mesorhizobium onobrychidis TaxID=2775404 RepID=UPI00215717B5|nr:TOBE domain-containing protein [Mesorhizobium onobrychidis]
MTDASCYRIRLRFHNSIVPTGELRGKMIVSIRPESFRFNRDNDTTQSAMGRVEDVIFIGSRSFYTICLADGVRAVGSHHDAIEDEIDESCHSNQST